jgi:hypothetical protein
MIVGDNRFDRVLSVSINLQRSLLGVVKVFKRPGVPQWEWVESQETA